MRSSSGSSDDKIFNEDHNTSDSIGLHTATRSGSSAGNTA